VTALLLLALGLHACRTGERDAPAARSAATVPAPDALAGAQRPTEAGDSSEAAGAPAASDPAPQGVAPGERATLRARSELGVPLHARAEDSAVVGRLPDGAEVTVLATLSGGRWLEIEHAPVAGPEGPRRRSFIVRRYLRVAEAAASLPPEDAVLGRARCLEALASQRPPASPRLAAYNVRWFPDGAPGSAAKGPGTDLEWLACTLAATGAEAVALQEWKQNARAVAAAEKVLSHLERLTGHRWQRALDACPSESVQHVGVLWDTARATLLGSRTIAELNPRGSACADSLRPGLGAALRLSDGTELELVSIHAKSGTERRSLELRRTTRAALAPLTADSPRPLVLAGDFNTMGCPRCSPPVSASDDRSELAASAQRAGLTLVALEPACTHYYRGEPGLLDGFVVDARLASRITRAWPSGYCAALGCGEMPASEPAELGALSDHCPVVLQLGAKAP
jgi:endonuclease/exonuclease/phosphatase family metal-dependent hydrolase